MNLLNRTPPKRYKLLYLNINSPLIQPVRENKREQSYHNRQTVDNWRTNDHCWSLLHRFVLVE